ncbi:MAG: sigma-70 family RNA polymerase sigma factor [Oscillospiraceae bacterium]|nr:sigma-70 family RNA polymerase sigma factor [Oscillospiraceae bacterium]
MDDAKIIELYWQRCEAAISETQIKYGKFLFSIANRILPFREDAQECVNDTYLDAWNAMPPTRPNILSAFLGKLTRRISIDRWRCLNAEKRGGSHVTLALEELAGCIPGESDPAAEVEAKELAQAINRFLDDLPRTEQQVFVLRYFHLACIQEIAAKFSMSSPKVKSMLHRTRKKLRMYLAKEGYR